MKLWISLRNRKQLRIARYSTLSLIIITDLNLLQNFFQIKEINFDKLFSLVVCYKIACLFLAISTLEDWDIYSIDIKTAYLYSNLDEKIYMGSLNVLGYLAKKRKSGDFTKYCMALSKLAYLGGRL